MRGYLLSIACLALLIGFVASATGIRAGLYDLLHHRLDNKQFPFDTYALEGELHRCRDLGVAAYRDILCDAAWTAERRQDFGCARTPGAR